MALYTPRGLKLRLPASIAFALMARLYPKVDAFTVLKTTEGLEASPAMLAFLTGMVSFYLGLDELHVALYVFIVSVLGRMVTMFGLFVIPGIPTLGTLYSYVSGFGLLLIVLGAYGLYSVGWKGVVAFFAGKYTAGMVSYAIEAWNTKRIYSKSGLPATLSEINFFNAYRLHASEIGQPTDIALSDSELKEENWKECFEDLALRWPEVVARFKID
ncbi:MAG: hypothetical protein HY651_09100 [Acidobacteria bacterium]|nr:hypothetical protein [Acidobacteriota bacterium]